MIPGFLRKRLAIPDREVTFEARGFHPAAEEKQSRLEGVARTFVEGYHSALDHRGTELQQRLARIELEDRGFAFEGAAMALAIQDALTPFGRRLKSWLAGPGEPHAYMSYVGAGWAMARIPWRRGTAERRARALHAFLWPLVIDGFGFHQGYFNAANLDRAAKPSGVETKLGRSAYDRGLGRSLWFISGADPFQLARTIQGFPRQRHSDLWSGAGLACAYAGGVSAAEVRIFARLAGDCAAAAGQGACFAAKARMRAGNPAAHTDMACRTLCGMSGFEAARLSDQTYAVTMELKGDYRDWCKLIESTLEGVSALRK